MSPNVIYDARSIHNGLNLFLIEKEKFFAPSFLNSRNIGRSRLVDWFFRSDGSENGARAH